MCTFWVEIPSDLVKVILKWVGDPFWHSLSHQNYTTILTLSLIWFKHWYLIRFDQSAGNSQVLKPGFVAWTTLHIYALFTQGHNSFNRARVKSTHCRARVGQRFRQKRSACNTVAINHTVKRSVAFTLKDKTMGNVKFHSPFGVAHHTCINLGYWMWYKLYYNLMK